MHFVVFFFVFASAISSYILNLFIFYVGTYVCCTENWQYKSGKKCTWSRLMTSPRLSARPVRWRRGCCYILYTDTGPAVSRALRPHSYTHYSLHFIHESTKGNFSLRNNLLRCFHKIWSLGIVMLIDKYSSELVYFEHTSLHNHVTRSHEHSSVLSACSCQLR